MLFRPKRLSSWVFSCSFSSSDLLLRKRPIKRDQNFVVDQGFGQQIKRTRADRFDPGINRCIASHQQHDDVGMMFLAFGQQLQPVFANQVSGPRGPDRFPARPERFWACTDWSPKRRDTPVRSTTIPSIQEDVGRHRREGFHVSFLVQSVSWNHIVW